MKKLTRFAVNSPITVLMIILAVLLLGFISFGKLGIDLFPDLKNPRIFVEIKAGERPPEEIEEQFVENIESLAIRQRDVIQVSSVCQMGSAQITVEYTWEKDMDEAFLDLQKTLSSYSQNSQLDEFNITQHDPNAVPVLLVGLSHNTINDMNELRKVAENYIRNELVRLEGIADVQLSGQEEGEIVINTNKYLLDAHNLESDDIVRQINNFNRNVSGGSIVEMGNKYIVKGVGVLENLEDIEDIIVTYIQSEAANAAPFDRIPIYLKDVASVEYRNKDPFNIVRINQERCIGLSIYKETKFNTVQAVNDLLEEFENIKKALPGYEFVIIQNQGEFINTAINEVKQSTLIGIIFAVIILFVFLRRIGTTAIVSIAIPISIIATFNLMYFNGLTLNVMTLGGLALGAGMLVDNAIVVMENIFRNHEKGMSIKDAAIKGTSQVGGAITASTITTIVVFLPIVYLHGSSGELFKDQAWTVAFSLFSSLFVAILVIPMLYVRFTKGKYIKPKRASIQFRWYKNFLSGILKYKWIVIILATGMVATAAVLIPVVGSEYLPKSETGEFSIELKLPEGTRLERTSQTVQNIETYIQELLGDNLQTIFSQVGPSSDISAGEESVFENENTATIKILLNRDIPVSSTSIISAIGTYLNNISELEVHFIQDETALQEILGTEESPIVVEIQGENFEQIEIIARQVEEKMLAMEDLFNIQTSIEEKTPEIEVVIDRFKAGLYNITVDDITSQLSNQLTGQDAGQIEREGEMIDITLKLPETELAQFADMTIRGESTDIPIDEIATINTIMSQNEIYRRNQNRIARVTSQYLEGQPFDHLIHALEGELDQISLPPNYKILITGDEQKRKESMENLTFALLLSIILVYMVLASQFESLVHPFTILLTIPLAGVGAILMFFAIGQALNIMAIIGIIMLIGIAVNDSIILVDAINQFVQEGLSRRDAIFQAGQNRIRPIVMTSLTTILALLPLTFGFGESVSLRSPMALAVIGGLVTSTILTLIVIPCVYYVLDQLKVKLRFK